MARTTLTALLFAVAVSSASGQDDNDAKFRQAVSDAAKFAPPPEQPLDADSAAKIRQLAERHAEGDEPDLSGVLTLANVFWFLASLLGVAAVAWLSRLYLWKIIRRIPLTAYEAAMWAVAIACMACGHPAAYFGSLMFPFLVFVTYRRHFMPRLSGEVAHPNGMIELKPNRKAPRTGGVVSLLSGIAWATLAAVNDSGVLAACCGIAWLVFLVEYALPKSHIVPQLIWAGLPVMAASLALGQPFTSSALLGEISVLTGLLVQASRMHLLPDKAWQWTRYWMVQFAVVGGVCLLMLVGSSTGTPGVVALGSIFFVAFILSKVLDFPWADVGNAWALLTLAIIVAGIAWTISTYPQYFAFSRT